MTASVRSALLAAAVLAFATYAKCGWTETHSPRNEFYSLALTSDTLVGAGTLGRMFWTTESGLTWTDAGLARLFDYSTIYNVSCFQEVAFAGGAMGRLHVRQRGKPWSSDKSIGTDDILAFAASRGRATAVHLAGGFGGGIRRSIDTGSTWTPANTGFLNLNVTSLASGYTLPDTSGQAIFAGTYGGGIYASTDNGLTWLPKNQGLSTLQVNALRVAGDLLIIAGSSGRIAWSSDWGDSWQAFGAGLPSTDLLCLATARDSLGEWIYVGTVDAGIWRCSIDGGTWSAMNNGLNHLRVNSIAAGSSAIFAATHDGIYRSTNGGLVWTYAGDLGKPRLTALDAIPARTEGGDDVLFAGTDPIWYSAAGNPFGSVFSSSDGGNSWSSAEPHFAGPVGVIAHRAGVSLLLASGSGDVPAGMSISTDMGVNWEERMEGFSHFHSFSCMDVVTRANGSSLDCYLGSSWGPATGMLYSSDTGRTWTSMSALKAHSICAMDSFLVACDFRGAYRTTDNGITWDTLVSHPSATPVNFIVRDGQRLLACLADDPARSLRGGIAIVTDAGRTWTPAGLRGKTVTSLVADSGHIFAAADGRIFAASRGSLLWTDVTGNLQGISIGIVAATPAYCYAIESQGGSIWKRPLAQVRRDLEAAEVVPPAPVLVSPAPDVTLFAAGAYLTWQSFSPDVTGFRVEIATDPSFRSLASDTLVADTVFRFVSSPPQGGRFWWRVRAANPLGDGAYSETRGFTLSPCAVEYSPDMPTVTALSQNYPNPFNATTSIWYSVGVVSRESRVATRVRLTVYDVLGREIAVLLDEQKAPGRYQVEFDATKLASGMYFYRFSAGDKVETRRMMLVR